jgi:hypothetical protein
MTCCACNGWGCPTCWPEPPVRWCDDNPTWECEHYDDGRCDGEPRADGGCPYLDARWAAAEDAAIERALDRYEALGW